MNKVTLISDFPSYCVDLAGIHKFISGLKNLDKKKQKNDWKRKLKKDTWSSVIGQINYKRVLAWVTTAFGISESEIIKSS